MLIHSCYNFTIETFILHCLGLYLFLSLSPLHLCLQVDLTEYIEKHEFVFDAVLNEDVSNDEVSI